MTPWSEEASPHRRPLSAAIVESEDDARRCRRWRWHPWPSRRRRRLRWRRHGSVKVQASRCPCYRTALGAGDGAVLSASGGRRGGALGERRQTGRCPRWAAAGREVPAASGGACSRTSPSTESRQPEIELEARQKGSYMLSWGRHVDDGREFWPGSVPICAVWFFFSKPLST